MSITQTIPTADDAPSVIAAKAKLTPLSEELQRLTLELHEYEGLLNPHVDKVFEPERVLTAHANIAVTRAQHAKVTLQQQVAHTAWDVARDAERQRLRAVLHEQKKPLVKALGVALLKARAANLALRDLEVQEYETLGGFLDPMHWDVLGPSDSRCTSRIDFWLERIQEHGFTV